MALQYFAASAGGYRYGEYVGGVFFGVIVTGANLTYDVNGVPVGGTISSMSFQQTHLTYEGWTTNLDRITFPAGTQVTTLTAKGFDWFDSAVFDITQVVFDVTAIISKFDKLGLYADDYETTPFSIIRSGNQDDRIYANDDPYFNGEIYSGAGKDKIFATGFSVYVDAGAENDHVTVSAYGAVVDGGTGKDTITITGSVYAEVNAGADDDKVTVSSFGQIIVDGGTGHDEITINSLGYEDYYAEVYGGKGSDTITGSAAGGEFLSGEDGNDVIALGGAFESDTYDVAFGGAGNDVLSSSDGLGYSFLLGEAGNDSIFAGVGVDLLWGGAGNDLMVNNGGDDIFFFEEGIDTAYSSYGSETFVLFDSELPTTGLVIGFDTSSDVIILDTPDNLDEQDSYDYFLANAVQDGDNVVFDDGAGYILILQDTDLGAIGLGNFSYDSIDGYPPGPWI